MGKQSSFGLIFLWTGEIESSLELAFLLAEEFSVGPVFFLAEAIARGGFVAEGALGAIVSSGDDSGDASGTSDAGDVGDVGDACGVGGVDVEGWCW